MLRRAFTMIAVLVFLTNAGAADAKRRSATPAPSASASPVASPSSSPASSPQPGRIPAPARATKGLPVDGAFTLPGIWNCETLANSSARSVYKLVDSRHITESTTLRLPNRPPVVLETAFTFDPHHSRWNLVMQKGAYIASAPSWNDVTWMFEGVETDADPHRAVRLVYTSLGPDSYRSDYQAQNHGVWQTFSGATCRRYIP